MTDPTTVLAHFFDQPRREQIKPLGTAGGFSGAVFWRVFVEGRAFCLRRWPLGHPSEENLAFVHAVLHHVARQGLALLPLPQKGVNGATVVRHDGHLWELSPWMPGRADFRENPTVDRLQAAMKALAEFHCAAATFAGYQPRMAVSPAIASRLETAHRLLSGDWERLIREVNGNRIDIGVGGLSVPGEFTATDARDPPSDDQPVTSETLRHHMGRLLSLARLALEPTRRSLQQAGRLEVLLQPCIRDVWHDHVLFTGDKVTGLVDFGAMGVETVAGDVARLLGSLAGNDETMWGVGLEAYNAIRPLTTDERALVRPLDQSGIVLAAANWAQWLFVEHRQFSDYAAVARRLEEIATRLESFVEPAI